MATEERHGFKRVIMSCTEERGPLLTRYHLIRTRWFGLYLHHLHTSDEDRALHDHPWTFATVLLSGGYFEHVQEHTYQLRDCRWTRVPCTSRYWRPRFSVLWRPAEFAHRLELVSPVWTLVLRFRVRRDWGFFTPGGWLHWRAYSDKFCD